MGQFKPMVKMMTTEPSVELKLKKGGSVKKADGGMMGAPMASSMPARGGMMPVARPMRPTMAARRVAMMGMKKGGMSEGGKADMAEDKAMIKKAFKEHDAQEHKGGKGTKLKLATGGVSKSTKPGEYATGGVVNGQGGFKKGGKVKMAMGGIAKSGIINTEGQGGEYRTTKMDTTKPDTNSAPTGDVKMGNGGGYKKGGATKKRFATGGAVNDSGHAVAYPAKKKSAPVSNDRQSGTFKKGGSVTQAEKKERSAFKADNATAVRQAKAMTNEKYGRKHKDGGSITDLSKGAYDKSIGPSEDDMSMAKAIRNIPSKLYEGAKSLFTSGAEKPAGSVTKTEKSVTVSPPKKRGGSVKC
jgi:hypothetical protein